MKIKSTPKLSLLVPHCYQFMYLPKDIYCSSTHTHTFIYVYVCILYICCFRHVLCMLLYIHIYIYAYKSSFVTKMVTVHFPPLLNSMWWIKDTCILFAIPPIESWSFSPLPLNLDLHVTCFDWWNVAKVTVQLPRLDLNMFCRFSLLTLRTFLFVTQMPHCENPKPYGTLDNNPSQHQQPSTWVSHFVFPSPDEP